MLIKSEKYTQGEFKAVMNLVSVDDSLLVSSQMANSLLLLNQHEKMVKDATQAINQKSESTSGKAPEPASEGTNAGEATIDERQQVFEAATAPPAPVEEGMEENDMLADLNAQLKNMLM